MAHVPSISFKHACVASTMRYDTTSTVIHFIVSSKPSKSAPQQASIQTSAKLKHKTTHKATASPIHSLTISRMAPRHYLHHWPISSTRHMDMAIHTHSTGIPYCSLHTVSLYQPQIQPHKYSLRTYTNDIPLADTKKIEPL
jgi:hypothetical protein